MNNQERITKIESLLNAAFQPTLLEITDDSHQQG